MDALKQISAAVAGLAGSALAAYMLHGAEAPYGKANSYFAERGGEISKTHPELAALLHRDAKTSAASVKALGATKTREERVNLAAQVFLGFWMINGEARGELCEKNGVDFTRFVEKFERRNRRQHEKALAYLEAAGLDEERLYKSRRDNLMQKLRMQMLYVNGIDAMSIEDACYFMLKQADAYVGRLDLQQVDSNLSQILLANS